MARKNDLDSIVNYIHTKIMPITLSERGKSKISNLLNQFKKEELRNAIDIGYEVYVHFDENGEPTRDSVSNFLDKIGGIAHNNSLSPIDQKLRHLKNIGKKNFNYWDEKKATSILNNYVRALRYKGWSDDDILNDLNNEAFERASECDNWSQWRNLFESWTESLLSPSTQAKEENDDENKLLINKEYEIVEEIGSGSFGITYLCKDIRLDKLFVMKKFSCGMLIPEENKRFFDKFMTEIVFLFNLHHQNIVSIYDYVVDKENDTGLYIMEYIDGSNIEEYIMEHSEDINSIFSQLIDAFCYLESKNICHRDIRINNILVTNDGEANLIDFGFVKNISESNSVHSATKVISYPYDWPEELRQKKQRYDIKTEIYFLGKLFEDLISRLKISNFNYTEILSLMISYSYDTRISSFKKIKSLINSINYRNDK